MVVLMVEKFCLVGYTRVRMDSGYGYQALLNQSDVDASRVTFTGLNPNSLLYTDGSGTLASATVGAGWTFVAGVLALDTPFARSLISAGSNISYNSSTGVISLSTTPSVTSITALSNANSTSVNALLRNSNTGNAAITELDIFNDVSKGLQLRSTSQACVGALGDCYITNTNNSALNIGTNNRTSDIYVSSTGSVGIGTGSPGSDKLYVSGQVNGGHILRVRNVNTATTNVYSAALLQCDTGNSCALFLNGSLRSADGGTNTATLRNDAGGLRLQSSGSNGIAIAATTGNVGIGADPISTAKVYVYNASANSYLNVETGSASFQAGLRIKSTATTWINYLDAAGSTLAWSNSGDKLQISNAGKMITAGDSIELGQLGSGDRYSYIDFHASGTPGALDYSARLLRNPGVNGILELNNSGTGGIYLSAQGSGFYQFNTVTGGSGYSYISNTTSASDKVQVAGSHQMRTYVDTSGNAICGTITATPLYLRTNNANRVTIDGSTGALTLSAGLAASGSISSSANISTGANMSCAALTCNSINSNTYQKSSVTATMMSCVSSGNFTIATPAVNWAHGLGVTPDLFMCFAICTTTDQGYAVNDVLQITNYFQNANSMNSVGADNTYVFFRCNPLTIVIANKTSGAAVNMTTTSWRMFFRAWRIL